MMRFIVISWICGIIFWILDGIINWNPYALKLYKAYQSNMRAMLNIPKSFFVYLIYGFAMAGIFLTIYKSLPGDIGIVKGLSFAAIAWFFRGLMPVMSQWMLYAIPVKTLIYIAVCGLFEASVLGMFLGLFLKI